MKIKTNKDILFSIFLHVGFIASFVCIAVLTRPGLNDISYVEVNFGLNEQLVQTQQESSKKIGEREALKAKDALPQLTKQAAPNIQEKTQTSSDSLAYKKSQEKKENDQNSKKDSKLQVNKIGKLDTQDFLKRKEQELRKIGDKTQSGQKNPNLIVQNGQKQSLDDLPKSPFESLKTEKAPISQAPTGVESGKDNQNRSSYETYLKSQLKLYWRLPDLEKYSSSLITIVSFTVNEYGYLSGDPKIVESSKNAEFDSLVLQAVESTFPVLSPPPKEIHPPQTFIARYNSKDVN